MCAIAGIIDLSVRPETIEKMYATMHKRGPDGRGCWQQNSCTLLHSRLAIIDPEGGKQPMSFEMAGECYHLIYNGELYNTQELRLELEQAGHHFRGHSDTEVLLHAYAQWGEECLQRLNGIFAFAVWEERASKLFLARDRIGVKPLFYALHKNGLLFASEMKTIFCYPDFQVRLEETGAAQLLLLGPGKLPESGIFQGLFSLEPGCFAVYQNRKLSITRYWKLKDRVHTESLDDTVEHVRWLVTDAITRQMVSDVPIGTFLSGGLDSSLISAVCAEKEKPLHTFSVDYWNNELYFQPGKFQPDSDTAYIHLMTNYLDSTPHWTVLHADDLVSCLEDATIARDLPGMADVDFSLLAFCREIKQSVKVALSGECADEIFGGYPWYRDPEIREHDGFPWAQNTAQRIQLLHPAIRSHFPVKDFVMDAYRKTCRESDILPENTQLERRMKEMVNLNFQWFMQTLLARKDHMSMYSGLEVRVPFCDYRIAEYLYAVPWEYKDYQGREKGLLRKAAEGLLPEKVLYRKKSPYPKTFDPEYERLIKIRLDAILADSHSPLFYLVDKTAIDSVLSAENPWPWYGQLMRRPQIMAYLVQLDFWLRHYHVSFAY